MPRRGEPSRQQQAFLSLLDQQYAASREQPSDQQTQDHKAGSRKLRKPSGEKQLGGAGKTPGFKLRELGAHARSDEHLQAAQQLRAIFNNAWDLATVRQVLVECNGSADAATDVLLALAASSQTNAIDSDAQSPSSSSAPVGMQTAASWYRRPDSSLHKHLLHLQIMPLWSPATGAGCQRSARTLCLGS